MSFTQRAKEFPTLQLYDAFRIHFGLTTKAYIKNSISAKVQSRKEQIKYRKDCENFMTEFQKEEPYAYMLLCFYALTGHATVYDLQLQFNKLLGLPNEF